MGSLFELVIAMTLAAVLSLVAVSGWQNFSRSDQASITMQQMAAAIHFARMEAIRRGEPVIFCKSSDHRQCGGEWRDGQLVMSARGEILRVLAALPLGDSLIWRSSFGRNDALTLLPTGYTFGQQGRFYYQLANRDTETLPPVLIVNQTGRVRIEFAAKPTIISG